MTNQTDLFKASKKIFLEQVGELEQNYNSLIAQIKRGRIEIVGNPLKYEFDKGDVRNGRYEFIYKWDEWNGKKWVKCASKVLVKNE